MSKAARSGDYLVVNIEKKNHLALVSSESKKEGVNVFLLNPKKRIDSEEDVEESVFVEYSDIVVNLGGTPKYGNVYGCHVEPHIKTIRHKKWGIIHFYRHLTSEEKENLRTALKKAYSRLKKAGVHKFLPVRLEIRHSRGKTEGWYQHSMKEGSTDCMVLCPKDFEDKKLLLHLITHESGHGIWTLVPSRLRAKWVSTYHKYVDLSKVVPATLKSIRIGLEECQSIKEYKSSSLSTKEKLILKHCTKYVNTVHGLRNAEIDILLEARKSLKNYWPSRPLEIPDIRIILTEYAKKNVSEFFAEAVRLHFTGTKLPKTVRKLLAETFSGLLV